MIITVKGRVNELQGRLDSFVEVDGERTTLAHFWGEKGAYGLVKLTRDELVQLVSAHAPYGSEARDVFFENLRSLVDQIHPTRD